MTIAVFTDSSGQLSSSQLTEASISVGSLDSSRLFATPSQSW